MTAGTLNLVIEQGATFIHKLTWKDSLGVVIDLTGYTAKIQIRDKPLITVLCELSTENSKILIDAPATGQIILTIPATETGTFDWKTGMYDLEMTNGDVVTRLCQGTVKVNKSVTR